jgi:hypothetical protein
MTGLHIARSSASVGIRHRSISSNSTASRAVQAVREAKRGKVTARQGSLISGAGLPVLRGDLVDIEAPACGIVLRGMEEVQLVGSLWRSRLGMAGLPSFLRHAAPLGLENWEKARI